MGKTITALLVGWLLTSGAADVQIQKVKKVNVRPLDLTGVKLLSKEAERSQYQRPLVITDAEGLADAFPDKGSQQALAKQVDFAKEKLLFFRWAGSGGDRLRPQVIDNKDGPLVVFRFSAGTTDDLRRHFHIFAVPRGIKWKVEP